MRIIEPNAVYMSKKGVTPYQFIEKIGRTCYKSEDKITEDSAVNFVTGLKNRSHLAMIELIGYISSLKELLMISLKVLIIFPE